jgi:hypothetical protein
MRVTIGSAIDSQPGTTASDALAAVEFLSADVAGPDGAAPVDGSSVTVVAVSAAASAVVSSAESPHPPARKPTAEAAKSARPMQRARWRVDG